VKNIVMFTMTATLSVAAHTGLMQLKEWTAVLTQLKATCESHDDCASTEYCLTGAVNGLNSCYPNCEEGNNCEYYEDAVDGVCPTAYGCTDCTASSDCVSGEEYCDVYNDCYPICGCTYWTDAIEGVDGCPNATESYCDDYVEPTACESHDDCASTEYCLTGAVNGLNSCYPNCEEGNNCEYYEDAVDGACPAEPTETECLENFLNDANVAIPSFLVALGPLLVATIFRTR
jgi:hypothetical protein